MYAGSMQGAGTKTTARDLTYEAALRNDTETETCRAAKGIPGGLSGSIAGMGKMWRKASRTQVRNTGHATWVRLEGVRPPSTGLAKQAQAFRFYSKR